MVRASLGCILSLFTFDWIAEAGIANVRHFMPNFPLRASDVLQEDSC